MNSSVPTGIFYLQFRFGGVHSVGTKMKKISLRKTRK